jgi:hypothetical protein
MSGAPAKNSPGRPTMLKRDKAFQPCPLEEGDEAFPNGIFEFNITRLLTLIDAHPEEFPLEIVPVAEIPNYRSSSLNEATVGSADLRSSMFGRLDRLHMRSWTQPNNRCTLVRRGFRYRSSPDEGIVPP